MTATPRENLAALRQAMKKHGLDAFVIPSADPHLSEYLPEHWQARRDLSGFTGSVGTLAEHQLAGTGIGLQKSGQVAPYTEWLAANLPEGATVGVPADMLSLTGKRALEQALAAKNIRVAHPETLLNEVWTGRPAMPSETVYIHHPDYVSESAAEKLARVRAAMKEQGADYHLISSLDDIAWITNLRGNDVPYNPVFLSFLLIGADSAVLFADHSRFKADSAAALQAAGIEARDYAEAAASLAALHGGLLVEPCNTAVRTLAKLPGSVPLI